MAKGTAVAPKPTAEVVKQITFAEAAAELISNGDEVNMDAMLDAIVNAVDVDDILSGGGDTLGLQECLGKPFTIHRVDLRESTIEGGEGGVGAFVVMHAEFGPGEREIVTTGAATIVAQCISLHRHGHIPGVRVVGYKTEKPTKAGRFPLQLRKATDKDESF